MNHPSRTLLALAGLACALTAQAGPPPAPGQVSADGDPSDWAEILANPSNATRDGDGSSMPCAFSTDRDCGIPQADADLARFAWCWNPSFFNFYFERYAAGASWTYFHVYVDRDADGLMETGEPVIQVRMNGVGTSSTTSVRTYTSALPGGDPLQDAQGHADGYTMSGNSGSSCCGALEGPVAGGLIFEGAVTWADLGLPGPSPIGYHAALSSNANVPGSILDNLGSSSGGAGTTAWRTLRLGASRELSTPPGQVLRLAHQACNDGNVATRAELVVRSAQGRDLTIWSDPNLDGLPDSMLARDAGGDGDLSRATDLLLPAGDGDGNGRLDVGLVPPAACMGFLVEESFPNNAGDTVETQDVHVRAAEDASLTDDATNTIRIGRITLHPDRVANGAPGRKVLVSHVLTNNTATAERIDVQTTSTRGWSWEVLYDPNGDGRDADATPLFDTDGNALPDAGLTAGESIALLLRATVPPGAALGLSETLVAVARLRGAVRGTVTDTVAVALPVDLSPDHVLGGGERFGAAGGSVYFNHRITNALDRSSTFQLSATTDTGWLVQVFADPDCDGLPYDAEPISILSPLVAGAGGQACVLARVDIPPGTPLRQVGRLTLTATASVDPTATDTAVDDAVVAIVRTYSDSTLLSNVTSVPPCTSLWAAASGLPPANPNLRFAWRDGSGLAIRVTDVASDARGETSDSLVLQPGDLGLGYSVDVLLNDGSTFVVQDTARFDILDPVQVESLVPGAPLYNVSDQALTAVVTLRNTSSDTRSDAVALRWVVVSPDRSAYLRGDGAFAPFTGTETTLADGLPRLQPGAAQSRTLSVAAVDYPAPGTYSMELWQSASCGGEYLAAVVPFEVVDDADFDGLARQDEDAAGTDPDDADSDDDGLLDGADGTGDSDGDGALDALDCDSDDDGLADGLEAGTWDPHDDTSLAAGCFRADAWPGTTTDPDDPDTDGGGVPDGEEDLDADGKVDGGETDPNVPQDDVTYDGDGDTIPDADEIAAGSDPNDGDSDDDGLADGTEWGRDSDGDLLDDAAECDSDGDGLPDGLEAGRSLPHADTDLGAGCFVPDADPVTVTDPARADTDGGGVPDGLEDVNRNGRRDFVETDPNLGADDDTDGDGLPDLAETAAGTSPTDRDSDDDGLTDGAETAADADGDGVPEALECDADGDRLPDGLERGAAIPDSGTDLAAGCFAADADPSTTTNPLAADTDGAGVGDGDEDVNRNGRVDAGETDPLIAADDDSDKDGLPNLEEDVAGTQRLDRDSDDDGIVDGLEEEDRDGDGTSDARECDTDGDGLPDGLERGVVAPDAHTSAAASCFRADADPASTTDPALADSDGGGLADGVEDMDRDGALDAGELDPNDPSDDGSCSVAVPPEVQGLRVTRIPGGARLAWTPLLDPCVTYVAWRSEAPAAMSPFASGLGAAVADDTSAAPAGLAFYRVSATSSISGPGPLGP